MPDEPVVVVAAAEELPPVQKSDVPVQAVEPPFNSKARVAERRQTIVTMAQAGYTTTQISRTVGMTRSRVTSLAKTLGVEIQASRVVKGRKRLNADRVLDTIVIDASNLTSDISLVQFDALDRKKLAGWVESLKQSRRLLDGFIRRLTQEQTHVEAPPADQQQ